MKESEDEHDPNLTKIDENVRKLQDAVTFIRRYKETIKTQKKRRVTLMKNQGQTLKNKDSEQFFETAGLSKSTIYQSMQVYHQIFDFGNFIILLM